MIKTPEAQRKRRFKTESGYKLRGAMVWVVAGIVAGLASALVAAGLSVLFAKFEAISWSAGSADCSGASGWIVALHAFRGAAIFIAIGVLLVFARRSVKRNAEQRYGEFAGDVGDWFGFGALISYFAFGVPLALLTVFVDFC